VLRVRTMAKLPPTRETDATDATSIAGPDTVGKPGTKSTPDNEQAGTLSDPNVVTGLLLYGTDSLSLLPKTVKSITIGSDPSKSTIVLASPFVSARHCRIDRKATALQVTDLKSKNGTFVDGERESTFNLKPGKTFIVGARPHCFLALNDQMRDAFPQLVDILGAENEHVIGGAREIPSPSDIVVAAVAGAPMLISSEPHCDEDRLARIVHGISRYRERAIVERGPKDIPADRKAQNELIKKLAARSTFVLNLAAHEEPLDATFVAMLFQPRHQVRVIVLARSVDVVDNALGRQHAGKLQEIWLRPIASRPEAIDRLFDRVLEEHNSPLRMSYLTPENQAAVRDYAWPQNFASLRQVAGYLTAIYRLGNINKAAPVLGVAPSTLYNWYSNVLKLSEPLSRRLISRDNRR
jgi:hypothetical protein